MGESMLSVVSPAFNEARNLPAVYENIRSLTEGRDLDWEWIIVDDHSTDDTPKVIAQLAQADPRVRGVRLSRNFGAHAALYCGLSLCRGAVAATLGQAHAAPRRCRQQEAAGQPLSPRSQIRGRQPGDAL
jgi:glycosyltransferase involved in cell wall biosynthesis